MKPNMLVSCENRDICQLFSVIVFDVFGNRVQLLSITHHVAREQHMANLINFVQI